MPDVTLSPFDRRVIGGLSIPRNPGDLLNELRADKVARRHPIVKAGDTRELVGVLEDAIDGGLVIKVGSDLEPKEAARALERNKAGVTMHDDKARNYINRLTSPARGDLWWRADGDLYAFTNDALELLTGPVPGLDAPELEPHEVQTAVYAEAQRVAHELELIDGQVVRADGEDKPVQLAGCLLLDEFRQWEAAVLEDLEARTGVKLPRFTFAGGGSYGDATELLILAADSGGTAYGETSPTYGALLTVAPTDADTGSTITRATYTGYADKSIAIGDYNAPSAGAHTNANAITWAGATAGSSTCIGFARVTAAGGGRLIRRASITSVVVSATNTPASIAAGALSETLD